MLVECWNQIGQNWNGTMDTLQLEYVHRDRLSQFTHVREILDLWTILTCEKRVQYYP